MHQKRVFVPFHAPEESGSCIVQHAGIKHRRRQRYTPHPIANRQTRTNSKQANKRKNRTRGWHARGRIQTVCKEPAKHVKERKAKRRALVVSSRLHGWSYLFRIPMPSKSVFRKRVRQRFIRGARMEECVEASPALPESGVLREHQPCNRGQRCWRERRLEHRISTRIFLGTGRRGGGDSAAPQQTERLFLL
jgi:hypothetical protein